MSSFWQVLIGGTLLIALIVGAERAGEWARHQKWVRRIEKMRMLRRRRRKFSVKRLVDHLHARIVREIEASGRVDDIAVVGDYGIIMLNRIESLFIPPEGEGAPHLKRMLCVQIVGDGRMPQMILQVYEPMGKRLEFGVAESDVENVVQIIRLHIRDQPEAA